MSALTIVATSLLACIVSSPALKSANTPAAPTARAQTASVAASPLPSRSAFSSSWWHPEIGVRWQWQLSGPLVESDIDAEVFDTDLFETDTAWIDGLHARGKKAICYLNAGAWENWRPDAARFPPETLGVEYTGWPGERWLDIRRIDLLGPVLQARLDLCRAKGFDGVEPDNLDGFLNDTGFALTAQDQLRFNRWLAEEAHHRGLAIGLKNDPDQAQDLSAVFDFALTEDCFAQEWCEEMLPFLLAGKPVLAAEYTDTGAALEDFCGPAAALGMSFILKHRDLDSWRLACP